MLGFCYVKIKNKYNHNSPRITKLTSLYRNYRNYTGETNFSNKNYFKGGVNMSPIRVFEAFAGYGSQSIALKNIGVPHKL